MDGGRDAVGSTPDASASSALPSLALPKGGGAIRGIGEKFSISPATGTASLGVPIVTTPGRSDFTPQLTLTYDSGAGNGPFGLGWSLSVPSISRKTEKEIPRYEPGDVSDTFLLSGAEDLVPAYTERGGVPVKDVQVDGPYRRSRYRPRTEGLFARIERWEHTVTGDVHWRSVAKDNVTSIYGRSAACRVADPSDPRRVFRWLLEESRDDRGSIIVYEYKPENAERVTHESAHEANRLALGAGFANRYLKYIHYGNARPGAPGGWLFHVVLDYGEHDPSNPTPDEVGQWPVRLDPFSSSRAGFEIRMYRLCRRVLMFHEFPELGGTPCLVRSTDFAYDESAIVTYLHSVTQRGYIRDRLSGQYSVGELPALEFAYTRRDSNLAVRTIDRQSVRNLPYGIDGARYQWVDLDSEGIPGVLVEEGGAWYYKRNQGGEFGPVERLSALPTLANLAGGGQQVFDLAGDGRQYLVQLGGEMPGYQARQNGGWGPFTAFVALPTIPWSDPNLKFIDLNGDGFSDVLITEDECFTWYPSQAREGFAPGRTIRKAADENEGPRLVFADGTDTVYTADMSGDGLADLVRIRNGEVCYWPNLGHGRFGAKVVMSTSPRFASPNEFDPGRLRLADIDGSGTTDIVYLGPREVTLWFNQAGNGWSAPEPLAVFPPADSVSHVMVADLFGKGTACLVWNSPLPHETARPMRFIDLVGDRKPHLLRSIKNNLGLETAIEYDASTRFYIEDRDTGRPWVTKLPFPVHVVTRTETRDWIADTKLVTTYRYRHGYYDGVEREFRGFGYVEQRDTESVSDFHGVGSFSQPSRVVEDRFYAAPVLTKSWFHTGFFLDETNISKHFADEYYAGDRQAALLPDTALPPGLTAAEAREACRALRGELLRQEVYALDDSPLTGEPYVVSERNYGVARVQPTLDNRHAVFYTHPREALTYHYERRPADPRVVHDLTLEVDAFGNVRRAATIAYPRRAPAFPQQAEMRITFSERDVINRADSPAVYQLGLVYDARTWELTGAPPPAGAVYSFDELASAISGAAAIDYEVPPTSGRVEKRLIQRARTTYYGDGAIGELPLGQAGVPALVYRTYRQAFTPGVLTQAFGDRVSEATVANEAKYVMTDGVWWAPSGRNVFDPARFYFMSQFIDPFEGVWTKTYDAYALLLASIVDPVGNVVAPKNNYRMLQPYALTDVNGNRTAVRYDAFGVVVATAVMGKAGETQGDFLDDTSSEVMPSDDPTTRLEYRLSEWVDHGRPAYVHTFVREQHGSANPRWQESYTYSDGSGREAMKKIQAEAGLAPSRDGDGHLQHRPDGTLLEEDTTPNVRWLGTGRTVFNNKGNPVKQYEPFFSATFDWETEQELVEIGVTPILTYDPLGRLVRTEFPNATFSKVQFDPWGQEMWDQNDTVLESNWLSSRLPNFDPSNPPSDPTSEEAAAIKASRHAATPTVTHLDTLGRRFLTIDDNGSAGKYSTTIKLDIEGHPRSVTDARGRIVRQYDYDMLGAMIRSWRVDGGERGMFTNVAGKRVRLFDARQHAIRTTYDRLQRPTHLFVKRGDDPEMLAERTVYGEAHPDSSAARRLNLRGRVFMQLDGAGVVTNTSRNEDEAYDFKGNALQSNRRLARDYTQQIDWSNVEPLLSASILDPSSIEAALASSLESEIFTMRTTFDALNRPVTVTMPDASVIRPGYNEANLLDRVNVNVRGAATPTAFVIDIDYNAKGQREKLVYGNGVQTEYAYDDHTFRLTRLKTSRRDGAWLQGLVYTYDPVGNISDIEDEAQSTNYFDNSVVRPAARYEYDALYRLIRAEGREHIGQSAESQVGHDDTPRMNQPLPSDGQAMRTYVERYEYDAVGNILTMAHEANSGSWTRRYAYEESSNRLQNSSAPGDPATGPFSATYEYDSNGSMTKAPHLQRMESNFRNQLCEVDLGGGGRAYYVYDAAGQRVRKVILRQNGAVEDRIYLNAYEISRQYGSDASLMLECQMLHVMDDVKRIVLVETKTVDSHAPLFTPAPLSRYQLGNHLGSACVELDEEARIISFEEYYPYGATSYQAVRRSVEVSAKRYRYTGKERDDESGLYYHGARYYAPWLARWTSCDPALAIEETNQYGYVRNNPVRFADPKGHQAEQGQKDFDAALWYTLKSPGAWDRWERDWLQRNVADPYLASEGRMSQTELAELLATERQRARAAFRSFAQKEWEYENESILVNTGRGAQIMTRAEYREAAAQEYGRAVYDGLVSDPISAVITGSALLLSDNPQTHIQAAQVGQTVSGLTMIAGSGASLVAQQRGARNIGAASEAVIAQERAMRMALTPPMQFENIYPEDGPEAALRWNLEYNNGNWVMSRMKMTGSDGSSKRMERRPAGTYNFVVVGRNIYMDKTPHIDLAKGEPVDYAGQITFSRYHELVSWSNASGHYTPLPQYAPQAGLPLEKFNPHFDFEGMEWELRGR